MPLICINDLCHMYEWMRHLTRRNERVMSHVRTSHVAQLRWMNRVILMNESCHTAQACRQREPGAEERKPSVRWAPGLARAMQSAPREGVRHICVITHSYVCLHMCAVTYSYVCRGLSIWDLLEQCKARPEKECVIWLLSYVRGDSFIYVPWLIRTCAMTQSYVPWLICMGLARAMQGAPREGVPHVVICVPWVIHMCAVTHVYVCHDSFIHTCAVTHPHGICSSNAKCA